MWVYLILNNFNEEYYYYSLSDNFKFIQVYFKVIFLEGDKGKIKFIIFFGIVYFFVDKFGLKRYLYFLRRNENFLVQDSINLGFSGKDVIVEDIFDLCY